MNIESAVSDLTAMRRRVAPVSGEMSKGIDRLLHVLNSIPRKKESRLEGKLLKQFNLIMLESQASYLSSRVTRPKSADMSALQAARAELPPGVEPFYPEDDPDEPMEDEETAVEEPEVPEVAASPVEVVEEMEGQVEVTYEEPAVESSDEATEEEPDDDEEDEEADDEPPEEEPEESECEEETILRAEFSWTDPANDEYHVTVIDVEDLEHAKLTARATAEEWGTNVRLVLVGDSWGDAHRTYKCSESACRKIED